jgi:hypothetical protein
MSDERRQVLQMLAEQKITADEAERLLSVLESPARAATDAAAGASAPRRPKFLRVVVDGEDPHRGGAPVKVNIRVPMQLLRAGVRLSALMPPAARDQVNAALRERGVPVDVGQMKPENLEDVLEQLNELTVDVDQDKTKVRVFCE